MKQYLLFKGFILALIVFLLAMAGCSTLDTVTKALKDGTKSADEKAEMARAEYEQVVKEVEFVATGYQMLYIFITTQTDSEGVTYWQQIKKKKPKLAARLIKFDKRARDAYKKFKALDAKMSTAYMTWQDIKALTGQQKKEGNKIMRALGMANKVISAYGTLTGSGGL